MKQYEKIIRFIARKTSYRLFYATFIACILLFIAWNTILFNKITIPILVGIYLILIYLVLFTGSQKHMKEAHEQIRRFE